MFFFLFYEIQTWNHIKKFIMQINIEMIIIMSIKSTILITFRAVLDTYIHLCYSTYRRHWLVCRAESGWRRRTSDVVVSESRKWCQDTVLGSRSSTRRFYGRWNPEDGTRRLLDNYSRPPARSVSPVQADARKISPV